MRMRTRTRSTLAVLGLMALLTLAPSLALAAAACAPGCCPEGLASIATDADACRAAIAQRMCCADAPTPIAPAASFASVSLELPSFPVEPQPLASIATPSRDRGPAPPIDADLRLRTSPLRLSVVLLI